MTSTASNGTASNGTAFSAPGASPEWRRGVLRRFGASAEEAAELLAYNAQAFDHSLAGAHWGDEPFVEAWEGYAREARRAGVFACLREKLVQLRFPIREGISQTEAYRRAVRAGEAPPGPGGLALRAPQRLRLVLHPTAAGRVPRLITPDRSDFEALVRAFTRRNEPVPIPASMGACMVAGFNNWDRIRAVRQAWAAAVPEPTDAAWAEAFRALVSQKERYQDRFVLLSDGPYSAVPAAAAGLDEAGWRARSLVIRREHECAHYFTRRVLGAMQNNARDELIADYMGLTAAFGRFDAALFLRFMGLERYPDYRPGGRLENYAGQPPLGAGAFRTLQALVVRAAHALEQYSRTDPPRPAPAARRRTLLTLTRLTLEELASDEAAARLAAAYLDAAREAAHTPIFTA